MDHSLVLSLAKYNALANHLLFETVGKLSTSELEITPSPSRKNIFRLLQHLLAVEAHYLAQAQGRTFDFDAQALSTVESLQVFASQVDVSLINLVSSLKDEGLFEEKNIQIGGYAFQFTTWQILLHIFMHSAQHRGELSVLLSFKGQSLTIPDIIAQFAQESGQTWPW
jgi:uncharacterized damage-inducible protein DinB